MVQARGFRMHGVRFTAYGVRKLAHRLAIMSQGGKSERYRFNGFCFLYSGHAAMQAFAPPSEDIVHSLGGLWGAADSLLFEFRGDTASTRYV